MNHFYEKLNFKLTSLVDFESLRGDLHHQYSGDTYLKYSYINNTSKSYVRSLFSIFTNIAPCAVRYVDIVGETLIEPHKDYGLACAVNYYFKTASATTIWFNEKPDAVPAISNSEKSHVYNYSDLIIADQFVAQDDECYLLNTSQIHSVLKSNNQRRQFIQIQYDLDYTVIRERLMGCHTGIDPVLPLSQSRVQATTLMTP